MDTYSAAAAASELGTSTPRVLRAVQNLGLTVPRSESGVLAINSEQLAVLAVQLGPAGPVGLTRVQARVLAALARSPRGLASVRSVARRAGVSPTAAGRALRALTGMDLVRARQVTLPLGRATLTVVYTAAVDHPRWHELASALARITQAGTAGREIAKVVPYYLRHLFWNTAPSQLNVATSAPFIAKRLLRSGDLDGLAWGATHLPQSAWGRAARARGLPPRDRALAANLARAHR